MSSSEDERRLAARYDILKALTDEGFVEAVTAAVDSRCREFEKRIHDRIEFVLRESGLDEIIPGAGSVRGHVCHPEVVELVVALNARLMRVHRENDELRRAIVEGVLGWRAVGDV